MYYILFLSVIHTEYSLSSCYFSESMLIPECTLHKVYSTHILFQRECALQRVCSTESVHYRNCTRNNMLRTIPLNYNLNSLVTFLFCANRFLSDFLLDKTPRSGRVYLLSNLPLSSVQKPTVKGCEIMAII